MGKIKILDAHIANQIAAGEVVERPASIVKELIENSIDAGSTKIEIRIKEGGFTSIQVKDNGEGMDEDDVQKAFLRHATSKLTSDRDLYHIQTLGFRGEALPSIAAVSKLTIRTSDNHQGKGLEVYFEGGEERNRKEIAFHQGTEILVEDIFFNTPARLKYLKSLQTELGHIIDYVNRLSLSHPGISFALYHNERLIIRTSGNKQILHVIAAIYGNQVAKSMIKLENENLDFRLTGYIAKPEITRANKNHITILINGRYIKNYLLTQAIIRGYKTLLMINRFPIAVLHIEMDPKLVDVNVHPAKLEVRFSKEQDLMKFIEKTVYRALSEQSFIREPIKSKDSNIKYHRPIQPSFDFKVQHQNERKMFQPEKQKKSLYQEEPQRPIQGEEKTDWDDLFTSEKNSSFIQEDSSSSMSVKESKNTIQNAVRKLPFLEPIAQYRGTYIIAQSEEGLYLIDQHAAHERINYEKNLRLMDEEKKASQELLVPITMDFPTSEMEQLLHKLDLLQAIGFTVEPFGQQTLIIRSIPHWIPKGEETPFVDQIIQMLLTKGEINLQELRKDMIAGTSCKASIKANQYLTKKEMEALLEQLRETEQPFACPHGRPIIIHFSNYEIEKMFKRVV